MGYEGLTAPISKWDERFLKMAEEVATWSKDPSTQTGALLVSLDRKQIFLGYNGFPQRITDDNRLNIREEKYELIIHCEMNAAMNAERSLKDYTLYTYPFLSCTRCAAHMIQYGITRVVAPAVPEHLMERWGPNIEKSKSMFSEAGVQIVECKRLI